MSFLKENQKLIVKKKYLNAQISENISNIVLSYSGQFQIMPSLAYRISYNNLKVRHNFFDFPLKAITYRCKFRKKFYKKQYDNSIAYFSNHKNFN